MSASNGWYTSGHSISIPSALYALFEGGYPTLVDLIAKQYPESTGEERLEILTSLVKEMFFPYGYDADRLNQIFKKHHDYADEIQRIKAELTEMGLDVKF